MDESSDWTLVEQARAGDMDAFAVLVRRYQEPVIHFCMRMLGSRADAEDVAQETFVRLYRYLPRIKPEARFTTLLFGMARNATLNAIRDAKRRGRGVTVSLDDRNDDVFPIQATAETTHRPDNAARLREIDALVQAAIDSMPPDHREVLLLREVQGMDYEAIAEVVGVCKGTVKSRLARARESLRLRLETLGGRHL